MQKRAWIKKKDRASGVEKAILKWFRENIDPLAERAEEGCKEYDILCKTVGNVEVKEDRIAHGTKNYAIEFKDAEGEPSGIETTTAEQFVIVDWENVLMIPTSVLKDIIKNCKEKRVVEMGYRTLKGRQAMGWLIPCERLLNNPNVVSYKRWFPVEND